MWIDKKRGYKGTASEPELIDGNGIGGVRTWNSEFYV